MLLATLLTAVVFQITPIHLMPIDRPDADGNVVGNVDGGAVRGWIASVDLNSPLVRVRVVPSGDDPDGAGQWQTRLATVPAIAEREGAILAVNGDFFSAAPQTVFGQTIKYAPGASARVLGWGMSDGTLWARPMLQNRPRDTFWLGKDGRTLIESSVKPPAWAVQGVSGIRILIRDGEIVVPAGGDVNPRTAVGVTETGRLLLLVIDGRREGWSRGATLRELADLLREHGATSALNLDGGGSTTLWYDKRVRNRPINAGLDLTRPIADALIVGRR